MKDQVCSRKYHNDSMNETIHPRALTKVMRGDVGEWQRSNLLNRDDKQLACAVDIDRVVAFRQVDDVERNLHPQRKRIGIAIGLLRDVRHQPHEEVVPVTMQTDLTELRTCAGQTG